MKSEIIDLVISIAMYLGALTTMYCCGRIHAAMRFTEEVAKREVGRTIKEYI